MRKILELSVEEIGKLISENEKFNEIIYDEIVENERFWIEEEIHFLVDGMINYRIDSVGRNFINIEDHEDILQGFYMIEETFSGSKKFMNQLEVCESFRYEEDKDNEFIQAVETLRDIKVDEYDKRMKYDPDNDEILDFILSNEDLFKNLYVDNMGNIFKMIAA